MLSVRPMFTTAPSASVVNYTSLGYNVGSSAWNATETLAFTPVPILCAITNFRVQLPAAPGAGGKSLTFTLRKNGVDTACSVTISETDTFGSYEGEAITFSPGDLFSISCTPVGTPSVGNATKISFLVKSGSRKSFVMGGVNSALTSNDVYMPISGYSTGNIAADATTYVMPSAGKFSKLYVKVTSAPGGVTTRTFTLYKNGVATGLSATIGSAETAASSDNDVTFVAGDRFVLRSGITGAPTPASGTGWGLELNPDTDGETMIFSRYTNGMSASANRYGVLLGSLNPTASFFPAQAAGFHGVIAKKLHAVASPAPGVGTSYTFAFMRAGATQPLTCTISDSATSASDTTNETATNLDELINYIITPTNTPAALTVLALSSVLYIPPSYTAIY